MPNTKDAIINGGVSILDTLIDDGIDKPKCDDLFAKLLIFRMLPHPLDLLRRMDLKLLL